MTLVTIDPINPSRRSARHATPGQRWAAALWAAGALAVLVLAALLRPAHAGHGTHEQLGLPACGWVVAFDKPCPTCGMTTAFSKAADGSVIGAFLTQPFGALLALLSAAVFWGALDQAVLGRRVHRIGGFLMSSNLLWFGLGTLLAAWVYKWLTWNGG